MLELTDVTVKGTSPIEASTGCVDRSNLSLNLTTNVDLDISGELTCTDILVLASTPTLESVKATDVNVGSM